MNLYDRQTRQTRRKNTEENEGRSQRRNAYTILSSGLWKLNKQKKHSKEESTQAMNMNYSMYVQKLQQKMLHKEENNGYENS